MLVSLPPSLNTRLLVTIRETALFLSVGERTVWRWIEENRLPVFRVGRVTRIRRDVLE